MKGKYKYFIEHKELHLWLVIDGTLTNNPNETGIISFNEKWIAEKYLSPIEENIVTDYSGNIAMVDCFVISIWDDIRNNTLDKNKGADLYRDFIITEHEFI